MIFPDIYKQAQDEIPHHPWFNNKNVPIVVGAGRFVKQKEFSTLIRAFAQVLQHRPARLVLLGDGRERQDLEALVNELGIAESVWMPGFMSNPYAYLKQADVFVLSSVWEGFGNVLVEALALRTPVIATDCPSGPAEILKGGEYGVLVPVHDHSAIAEGILGTLKNGGAVIPKHWNQQFTLQKITQEYLEFFTSLK